jgi:hypothetical protein
VILLLGDREGYDVDGALTEMQSILDLANEKHNRWKDLKLVPEINALEPSSRKFRATWDEVWTGTSYQYGDNDCIDASMIGFLWSIVHGILYIICSIVVLLVSFPVLFIYDCCCSCLYRKLIKAIDDNLVTGLYVPTKSIDDDILTTMTALANKLSTDSKPVKVSFNPRYTYSVAEHTTEDDVMVRHSSDMSCLCFGDRGEPHLPLGSLSLNLV